ncbi:MAG: type III-A CRISPR-associated RAMP protein Csm5 [Candidatus Binataceae bacterium]
MNERPEYLRLVCLTPVHIGTGVEYAGGVDYITQKNITYLLDSERVLEKLYAAGQLRDAGDLKSKVESLFKHERLDDYALAQCSGAVPGVLKIRAAIRAGDGRPIIPGSSLKGALRTLIYAGRLSTNGPHSDLRPERRAELENAVAQASQHPTKAAESLEADVFRSSVLPEFHDLSGAQRDLMRMCSLSDALFSPSATRIAITGIAGASGKIRMPVEALAANSNAVLQLQLSARYYESMFKDKDLPLSWDTVSEWSRRHALHLLKTERQYFADLSGDSPRDYGKIIERLRDLREQIERADQRTTFLRLGWGSGWRTMTGDVLDDQQRLRLPPKSGQKGPKTRKVIVADGSQNAVDVLGWISLTPIPETEALHMLRDIPPPRLKPPPIDALAAESAFPGTDSLLKRIEALQATKWGEVADLYRRAAENESLKNTRLAALGRKISQMWKNDKRRLREAAEKFPELTPHLTARSG